ncbi:hypothetical protein BAU01nite_15710 [Brevibacterium aurantiacum]|nr:hypothetical protein BAU01nite_15710 [Brevibacterium aurantiacum]
MLLPDPADTALQGPGWPPPTSQVVHANDPEQKDAEDRKDDETQAPRDESDDD